MFSHPKNRQSFHFEQGVPLLYLQLASMSSTAGVKIFNCPKVACLASETTPYLRFRVDRSNCSVPSQFFHMIIRKSWFEQKYKCCCCYHHCCYCCCCCCRVIIIIIIIIIIIQIFKEESLSHSKVLFMRVLYLTNCSDLFKTL